MARACHGAVTACRGGCYGLGVIIPLAFALFTATAPSTAVLRIAVTDVSHDDGLDDRTARIFANNLVAELRKLNRVSVISMDEVRALLAIEANRQAAGCSEESSCLSEIADALGADVVVSGTIASLDGARVISLKRLDQKTASVAAAFDERLVKADGEELLAVIGPAVEKLFADLPVRQGETRGVAPEKARLLHPPPLPVWSTVAAGSSAIVVGGAALTAGLIAANLAATTQSDLDKSSSDARVDGALVLERQSQFQTLAVVSNALTAGAVVVAIAAGVMVPFTDWSGAGDVAP